MKNLAFEVTAPNGHRYSFFDDGSTDGFPQGSTIRNHIPLVVNEELLNFRKQMAMEEDGA